MFFGFRMENKRPAARQWAGAHRQKQTICGIHFAIIVPWEKKKSPYEITKTQQFETMSPPMRFPFQGRLGFGFTTFLVQNLYLTYEITKIVPQTEKYLN